MGFGCDAGWMLLSRVSILLLGVVQSMELACYLHPQGRGEYAILLWIPQLLFYIDSLGLGGANQTTLVEMLVNVWADGISPLAVSKGRV